MSQFLTDHQIGALILAARELRPHRLGARFDYWRDQLPEMAKEPHWGDCTDAPQTCPQCLYLNTMERVPGVREALGMTPTKKPSR